VLGGEALDVGGQGFLEAPLGLRRVGVGGWRVPAAPAGSVAGQVGGHPIAAAEQLLLGGAADRAELEQVPLSDPGHRPATPAVQ
jgi:hypothetical protein